jgi:hypothetical protein
VQWIDPRLDFGILLLLKLRALEPSCVPFSKTILRLRFGVVVKNRMGRI